MSATARHVFNDQSAEKKKKKAAFLTTDGAECCDVSLRGDDLQLL